MTAKFIIYFGIAVLILVILALRKDSPSKGGKHYAGKAKLIGRFTAKEERHLKSRTVTLSPLTFARTRRSGALKIGIGEPSPTV